MYFSLLTLKLMKHPFSNIQTIIDNGRVLKHKKFQLMNQVHFKMLDNKNQPLPKYLQKNEIETRILKLLYESDLVDLQQFRFEEDIRKVYNLDSLDITAIISSIQEQFNTIFDPDTYQTARSLDVIVQALKNDDKIV